MTQSDVDRPWPRWRRWLQLALLIGGMAGLGTAFIAAPLRATPTRAVPDLKRERLADASPGLDGGAAAAAAVTAASAAPVASAAGETPASCGEDQRAQARDPEPDADGRLVLPPGIVDPDGVVRSTALQTRPADVGYSGAMHRLDAALRARPDPFDRTLADWLDLGGVFGTPEARVDAVVQDAVTSDDPRAYGLAYQACHPFARPQSGLPSCARLSEDEWARLDPGNALPWVYALNRADVSGDVAAQRDAMTHIAASSHTDLHPFAGAAAVARLPIANPADLAAWYDAAQSAIAYETPGWSALTQRCKDRVDGDPARASWCARVAKLMFENTNDYWPHAIGGSIHRLLTGDPGWIDQAHQDLHLFGQLARAEIGEGSCVSERRALKYWLRVDAVGEIGLARRLRAAASEAAR